ncbi:hypothetical protein D9M72_562300 [compost metagenome]
MPPTSNEIAAIRPSISVMVRSVSALTRIDSARLKTRISSRPRSAASVDTIAFSVALACCMSRIDTATQVG